MLYQVRFINMIHQLNRLNRLLYQATSCLLFLSLFFFFVLHRLQSPHLHYFPGLVSEHLQTPGSPHQSKSGETECTNAVDSPLPGFIFNIRLDNRTPSRHEPFATELSKQYPGSTSPRLIHRLVDPAPRCRPQQAALPMALHSSALTCRSAAKRPNEQVASPQVAPATSRQHLTSLIRKWSPSQLQ